MDKEKLESQILLCAFIVVIALIVFSLSLQFKYNKLVEDYNELSNNCTVQTNQYGGYFTKPIPTTENIRVRIDTDGIDGS